MNGMYKILMVKRTDRLDNLSFRELSFILNDKYEPKDLGRSTHKHITNETLVLEMFSTSFLHKVLLRPRSIRVQDVGRSYLS